MKPGGMDVNSLAIAGNSPEKWSPCSHFWTLGTASRCIPAFGTSTSCHRSSVPAYTAVDVSAGWRANDRLRLSLTVQNLNDAEHLEFGGRVLIERSVFARFDWRL